eukprot:64464-Prymnesium_polylepis.1
MKRTSEVTVILRKVLFSRAPTRKQTALGHDTQHLRLHNTRSTRFDGMGPEPGLQGLPDGCGSPFSILLGSGVL